MATEPLPPQLSGYNPTKSERDAFNYLFERADQDQLGVLTGDRAVPFFSHSALPPLILGEIWQLADPENIGFLSQDRFGVACRLIAHAQARAKTGAPRVEPDDVKKQAPQPPTFRGHALPDNLSQPLASVASPASPTTRQQGGGAPTSTQAASPAAAAAAARQAAPNLNQISPADKANYARLFTSAGPSGVGPAALLDGDKAREIWVKSELPFDVLGQIWSLADTHARGQLDLTDFTIGMHLLHLVLDGQLPRNVDGLPKVLDPALYKAAMTTMPPSAAAAPASVVPQQQQQQLRPQQTGPAGSQANWAISPAEKQESDQWFDQLDSARKGQLEGEQAVGFFGQSGLGVEVLAKIWDLSDLRNEGHLNKDTFAVAMHLVKRAVADPSTPLPDSLPQDLVPPSLRSGNAGAPFGQQQQQQAPGGPQRDLLDLDEDDIGPASVSSPQQQQQQAGGFSLSPQTTGTMAPLSPQATGPRSPLGQPAYMRSLSPQLTGASASGGPARQGSTPTMQGASAMYPQLTGASTAANAAMTPRSVTPQVQTPQQTGSGGFESNFAPTAAAVGAVAGVGGAAALAGARSPGGASARQTSSTFFDDNDDDDLAANARSLQSQASNLRTEADSAEQQSKSTGQSRSEIEKQVQSANEEIAALQERVSRARSTYEAEREKVEELRTRTKEQQDVLARAKHELIRAESDLSALRMEKTEIEGELLRDKEDVRELKRKVALVEDEKRILAAEVDKLKKEARQNKGLGAIARKQLTSVEADRTKLENEVEQLKSGAGAEREEDGGSSFGAGGGVGAMTAGALAGAGAATAAVLGTQHTGASSSRDAPMMSPASPSSEVEGARAAAFAATAPAAQAATVALPQTPGAGPTPARTGTNPFERFLARAPPSSAPSTSDPTSPTSPTAGASTNPFARSPLASPPAQAHSETPTATTPAVEREVEPISSSEENKSSSEPTSLPLAAAAAIGTGAIAAVSAVGAGIYEAVTGDHHKKKEEDVSTTGAATNQKDLAATPSAADEPDPFGVPAAASTESTAGGFDSGFGDDFSSAPISASVPAEQEHDVPAPVEGQLGDVEPQSGFTDAVRDLNEDGTGPDAVQGTLGEVDNDAGFDEAFKEIEEHEHSAGAVGGVDKGKGKEVERDIHSDDDDEDDGPEEAFGSAPRYASNENDDDPLASTAASTDFGTASVGDLSAVSGASAAPFVAAEVAPSAEIAHKDDEAHDGAEPAKERDPTNNSSESGESFVHVPPAGAVGTEVLPSLAVTPTPTSTRRAAPPPPVRAAAVDNGFTDASASPVAQADETSRESAPLPTQAPEDDFESAFADMSVSSPAARSAMFAAAPVAVVAPDFDSFENDFDFQPSFDSSEAAVAARNAHMAAQVQSEVGGTDFDDAAFADFDSSFPSSSSSAAAPLTSPAPAVSASGAADEAFDAAFDDSFNETGPPVLGAPVGVIPTSPVTSTTAATETVAPEVQGVSPPAAAPRLESFAGEEEGVRVIRQMGFSREQALEALDKYDGDVNRAVNSLVG